MTKYVYQFKEGDASMKNLLGGKGANLAEMARLGLPVPLGFTITTEACTDYYEQGGQISPEIEAEIWQNLAEIEQMNGKEFGNPHNPLLVSVRSGARSSMPGMMDTILNLGLNDEVLAGLIEQNPTAEFRRFIYDSYRRFIQMFSDVVMEIGKAKFEEIISELKQARGVDLDIELGEDDMKELVERFKTVYREAKGSEFPADPKVQLFGAIQAVFRSWDNDRANVYRRMNNIPYEWGTAVNVQPMVFGNLNNQSATGVAFTRNPATGEAKMFGEYLINAQGEDVVAGVRTPSEIKHLAEDMPEVYQQFTEIAAQLETHYKDMQDLEFTIENGKFYILQTRNGKRTASAALKIAIDLVDEGVISERDAVLRVEPQQMEELLHSTFDPEALAAAQEIGQGLAASPGAAVGQIVFSAETAKSWAEDGQAVILVRLETSPEDIEGMVAAEGILTVRGGMTSHAAVVARGMGECCVSGCEEIEMHAGEKYFVLRGKKYHEGDWISLNGSTGKVYEGQIKLVKAQISDDFAKFMDWADSFRQMGVRANADNARDTRQAVEFGAEGIGLCRTEHMFFEADRILAIREMIVAETSEAREKALAKLLPMQQNDFEQMYEALAGAPMTIRYLDPPLHEFLPTEEAEIRALAEELKVPVEKLPQKIAELHEFNPMLGHRGSRLAISYPEIARMQTQAVIGAAIAVNQRHPEWNIEPEIMLPLISDVREFDYVRNIVVSTADPMIEQAGVTLKYYVGTMIETPRACIVADEIAAHADFFSFGSNDLTQMAYGFSRDDSQKFLEDYYAAKVFESDPFRRLDQTGVGELMKMAVAKGGQANPKLKLGICGEHGGEPTSVEFCYGIGLDYVSCSPFRVPIARLAAAQASIRHPRS